MIICYNEAGDKMIIYLVCINIIGFLAIALDKYKAKHHQWRILERRLLWIAFIGGGVGTYLGMYITHHKTHKRKFYLGVPLICLFQLLLVTYLLLR